MGTRIGFAWVFLVILCGCDRADERAMRTLYDHEYAFKITDFFKAARTGDREAIEAFLEFGMEPDVDDGYGQRCLLVAAAEGEAEVVRVLLAAGSEVGYVAPEGETPLLAGAGSGSHRVVEVLLDAGADPGRRDNSGWGALTRAVSAGSPRTVEQLVKLVPDQRNEALLIAAVEGEVEATDILLAHGAELNTRSRDGNTPLHYASMHGHRELVELLAHHGADRAVRNEEGRRAADVAKSEEVRQVLSERR